MKSQLFASSFRDRVIQDVVFLAAFPEAAFSELVTFIQNTPGLEGRSPTDQDLLPLALRLGVPVPDLSRAFNTAFALYSNEVHRGDALDDVFFDLLQSKAIDSNQEKRARERLERAWNLLSTRVDSFFQSDRDLHATFPALESIQVSCALTARFKPRAEVHSQDPATYRPDVAKLTPVVVLQLDIDRFGESECISIGISRSELEEMIRHLELARIQLEAIDRHLKVGSVHDDSERPEKR